MMTLYEIVMKLNGEIYPVGETHEDKKRFENLENLIVLIDDLTDEVVKVSDFKDRSEYSIKKLGTEADRWLKFTKEWLEAIL